MSRGKKLENDVKKYLKDNIIFHHKFQDSYTARTLTQPVPSDFIIWPEIGPSIMLECKMSEKERIPLSAFRPSQFTAMRASLRVDCVNYYVLVNYNKEYYLLSSEAVLDALDAGLKSINLDDGYLTISTIEEAIEMMLKDNNGSL